MCQNNAFVLKIANMRLTKNYVALFTFDESCQLLPPWSKLPPPSPQFGQLVQPFSAIEIQDLKVSLGLKNFIYFILLYRMSQKIN